MKFNASSKTLHAYASAVAKVINSKNAIAILDNFLMTLDPDAPDGPVLIVKGSDTDSALVARVPVTGAEGAGSFCLDANRIVTLLKELPDQGVTFEIDGNYNVHISYSTGEYRCVAIAGDQYPLSQKEENAGEPVSFSCPGNIIVRGIENTLFAAATDDFRAVLTGVSLDVRPDGLTFVATDTRKLVKYVDRNVNPGVEISCVIPPKTANVLRTIFTGDEELKITLTAKSATFQNSAYTFNCRFLQGNYPDYNRVIPRNNSLVLTVDRLTFLSAVRRMQVFINEEYKLEKFRVTSDCVEIKAVDPNMQTLAHERVPASFTGDHEVVIGFSATFLIEMLSILGTDDITVHLSDPGRPGIFRPSSEVANTEMLMLLMPMTVGEF